MRTAIPMKRGWCGLALLAALALACGGPSAEEQLQAATEVMNAAEAVYEKARTDLQDREADLITAQEARDAAAEALEVAEASLAQAEAKVGLVATDDLLFRLVQQRLLDDPALGDVAVEARVANGRVTLSGFVPDSVTRDAAVEIAGSVTGVRGVTSRLRIGANAPEEATEEVEAAEALREPATEAEPEAQAEPEVAPEREEAPAAAVPPPPPAPAVPRDETLPDFGSVLDDMPEVRGLTEEEAPAVDDATPQIPMPDEFRAPIEEEGGSSREART